VANPIACDRQSQANKFTLRDLEIHERIEQLLDRVRSSLERHYFGPPQRRDVFTVFYSGAA
jgi:hypothetical protein